MEIVSEILALLAAFFFAVSNITAKKGNLAGASTTPGYFVNSITSVTFFTLLLPFVLPPGGVPLIGIVWYVVSGVTGTLLGRAVQYFAIDKMGASSAVPVANTFPIFSTLIAVLFLGEGITIAVIAGTILTVLGLVVISSGTSEGKSWKRWYLVVPLSSAFCFGLGNVMRKVAVGLVPDPVLGTAINVYAAFLVYSAFLAVTRRKVRGAITRRGGVFFAVSGVMNGIALVSLYAALGTGLVTVIGPLASVVPLFVLPLAYVFLRKAERLTAKTVAGACLIVLGVVLVTV